MIDSETGEYAYEDIVEVPGVSKQQLTERAGKWIELYYKDKVIDHSTDKGIKKTVIYDLKWKFISKYIKVQVIFDLEIRTKDSKYKYRFSNFRVGKLISGEFDGISLHRYIHRFPVKYQILIEEPIDSEMTSAIESLEKYMRTEKYIEEEDNW